MGVRRTGGVTPRAGGGGCGFGSPDHSLSLSSSDAGRSSSGRAVRAPPGDPDGSRRLVAGSGEEASRRTVRAPAPRRRRTRAGSAGSVRSKPPPGVGLGDARDAAAAPGERRRRRRRDAGLSPSPRASRAAALRSACRCGSIAAAVFGAVERSSPPRRSAPARSRRPAAQRAQAGEAGAFEPCDAADADVEPARDAAARARGRGPARSVRTRRCRGEVVEAAGWRWLDGRRAARSRGA